MKKREELGKLLLAAAFAHVPEAVEIALREGADPNYEDRHGTTALHIAAFSGDVASVKLLLEYGANKNAVSRRDATPLDAARISKNKEIIALLES